MNVLIESQKKRIAELEEALLFYTKLKNWCIGGRLDGNSSNWDGGPAKDALNKKLS
jgi:hypothetical protein